MLWASPVGPAPDSLIGRYTGLFSCSLETYRFSLELSTLSDGRLSGEVSAEPLHEMWGSAPRTQSMTVRGTYTPKSGGFALVGSALIWRKHIDVQGVFHRDGSAWVAAGKPPADARCSSLVAVKGTSLPGSWRGVQDEAEAGSRLKSSGSTLKDIGWSMAVRKSQSKTTCDDEIAEWVAQVPPDLDAHQRDDPRLPVRQLFRAERFEPFFGGTLDALTVKRRRSLYLEMSGPCARDTQLSRRSSMFIGLASSAIVNQPNLSATDVMISGIAADLFDDWQRDALAHLAALSADEADVSLVDAVAADARPFLPALWVTDAVAFEQAIADRRARILEPSLRRELALVVVKAEKSGEVVDLLSVARFVDRHRSDLWTLPPEARARFEAGHARDLDDLTAVVFEPELKAIGQSPPGLERLARSAAWYREHDFIFSGLPELGSVSAMLDELSMRRGESAAFAGGEFGAILEKQRTAADLMALKQKYFIDPDRGDPQLEALLAALQKRRESLNEGET